MKLDDIQEIITKKVEEAVREAYKVIPQVKDITSKIQGELGKIDLNWLSAQIKGVVNMAQKKIEELKKTSQDNKIKIEINNKEAEKEISQVQKQIESLQEKINSRKIQLEIVSNDLDKIYENTSNSITKSDTSKNDISNKLSENKNYTNGLELKSNLANEIKEYNNDLEVAKARMSELNSNTNSTGASQNSLNSFITNFSGKIGNASVLTSGLKNAFSKIPNVTKFISNSIKKIGFGLIAGVGSVIKFIGSIFSLQKIYGMLSSSANSWLSSQNQGAMQLSSNIEYMKTSMGSAFAPIIEWIINLVYELMRAIQSVVYALFKVNIFAGASAKSYSGMATGAKNESKQLLGVQDEINNIQSDSSTENSGGGSGAITPSFDLSNIDGEMSKIGQKLLDFFSPLKISWDNYGNGLIGQLKTTAGQVSGLIGSIWGSFENIITNGTVYSILENIFAIIGDISTAFSNAWNNNGNGDAIIQNLADAFNNLLKVMDIIVKNVIFQWLLDVGVEAIKLVTEFIKKLTEGFEFVTEKIQEFIEFFTGENTEQLSLWSIIIGSIATAIGLVVAAILLWNVASGIATFMTTAFGIAVQLLTSPITLVILVIAALIAIIVSLVVYWEEISNWLAGIWNWICELAVTVFTAIGNFFKGIWEWICNIITDVWNGICNFFKGIWDFILNIAVSTWNGIITTIANVVNNIRNTISTVLNAISTIWNNIWNGIKTVVSNVWSGIWNCIKSIINSILGGIEGFVNGVIKGINFVLGGISDVANAVGSLIGLDPINLRLNTISLPRLAKGNVAYKETLGIFGEYSGASNNPEITTPQNIMEETFDKVLSRYDKGNKSPTRLQIYWGNKAIVDEVIDGINERSRQIGKPIVKVSYS